MCGSIGLAASGRATGGSFGSPNVQPRGDHPLAAQESFAPAQFFDLTDEEKLTSASFKNFDSGVRVGDAGAVAHGLRGGAGSEVRVEIHRLAARPAVERSQESLFDVDVVSFNTWTLQGAISKSELSFARNRKSSLAPEAVAVAQERSRS